MKLEVEHERKQLFQYLKLNLDDVVLPTIKWSSIYLAHSKDIIFGEWNENYQFKKQVILHSAMTVQVKLHRKLNLINKCIHKNFVNI